MHPADQFDAFKKLADEGKGEEEIAARFGITPRVVQQRLKLAVVSPKLIALYHKGEMTLDCLMAFTVSDDHRQQEKVWAARPKWGIDPDDIRATLTEQHVLADGKLAKFVGIKAYGVVRFLIDECLSVDTCLPVEKVCSIDEMACRLMGTERQVPVARELALKIKRVLRDPGAAHARGVPHQRPAGPSPLGGG